MNNQIQLVLKSSTAEMSLNDQALGIYLTPELDGLVGLPEIRTTSGVNAGYDGGWTSAQNYDARSITIRGVIANEDVATVERLRKQLVSLAGQGKSEELTLDLVTEAGNAYTLQVRTIALEMSMQSVLTQQQFMLQLRADDPLIYDAGESEHEATLQVAQATGGFTIDFELPLAITGGSEESVVNNDGLEEVPTIVKMYGALHNPKIINQTNNEQMQIMTDLGFAEGAWHTPSEAVEGANVSLANTPDSAPFSDVQLKGDAYQNGTPTPSVPVAVQTVTGENVVKICGKNLFDYNTPKTHGYLDTNGKLYASGSHNEACYDFMPVEENTTYIFKIFETSDTIDDTYWFGIGAYSSASESGFISMPFRGITAAWSPYVAFTTPQGSKYIRISGRYLLHATKLQLELGSTATTYEPYQNQSYQVDLIGKNKINPNQNWTNQAVDSSGNVVANSNTALSYFIPVKEATDYVFSQTQLTQNNCLPNMVSFYTETKGFLGRFQVLNLSPQTFTTPSECAYIRFGYYKPNGLTISDLWNLIADAQLEVGTSATTYEAFWQYELCKIDTYQDYIYKSGGKWYKHQEVGIADLSQDVNTADTYHISGRGYAIRVTSGTPQKTTSGAEIMRGFCDKLTLSSRDAIYATGSQNSISVGDPSTDYWKDFFLDPDGTNGMSAADFNTWLSNNPIKVYYVLATPTDTEITNEALVAQLDDLLNLTRTYQGQTNMADLAASGNMPAILNVSYFTEQDPDTRDELIIDSRLHTVTLNGLDIYHLIGEGSEFLMLEPGENRLSLQSDITGDNGYAVVSYKQGYLSI